MKTYALRLIKDLQQHATVTDNKYGGYPTSHKVFNIIKQIIQKI